MEGAKQNLHLKFVIELISRDYDFDSGFRKLPVPQALLSLLQEHYRKPKKEDTQGKFTSLKSK